MRGNPITQTIEEDCQKVIDQLASNTDKMVHQKKILENMEKQTQSSPQTVKLELDDLKRDYAARVENRNQLIPDMVKVRELYKKKQQFENLKMEVPGEIMSQLVETVLNVKTETYRLDREMEEIKDDFETVYKGGAAGGPGGGNKSMFNPNKSLSNVGKSILSAPTGGREMRPNLMKNGGKGPHLDPRLEGASNLSMLSTNKNPRQFTDYLSNYQAELSKSLLLMDPSSIEFKKRMEELAQISQMKNSFVDFDTKNQLLKRRGMEEAKRIRAKKMSKYEEYAGETNLKLINDKTMGQIAANKEANENILKLQTQLTRMNETVRGMEDLVREKERQAAIQRQKYEMLERERHLVEIEKIRADREQAEADHMKKLQRMNVELDYVEQMKLKTMNILSGQLQNFTKMQEDRWKKRQQAEKEYQKQKLVDMQKEFTLREKKRQAQFDSYMLALEEKMGMALKHMETDNKLHRLKDVDVQVGNQELMNMFGVGENFHDQKYNDITMEMGKGDEELEKLMEKMKKSRAPSRKSIQSKGSRRSRKSKGSRKSNKSKRSIFSSKPLSQASGKLRGKLSRPSQSFISKSRRSSVKSKSSRITDKEEDPDSAFIYISKLKHLPENCTYTMIICALLNSEGEPVKDLGNTFSELDSDSMNPRFKGKIKIPLDLMKDDDDFYLYAEIKTIDDGVDDLPVVSYGNFIVRLGKENFSREVPIFFDTFSETVLDEFRAGELEQYLGSSVQLTYGIGKVERNKKFKLHKSLNTADQKKVRKFMRQRQPEIVSEKVKYIASTIDEGVDQSDIDKATEIVQKQIMNSSENVKWLIQRYYVPIDVMKTDVHIEIIGFINDSDSGVTIEKPELFFCRVLMNPDPKGKNRPVYVTKDTNFISKLQFQLMNKKEYRFSSKSLTGNSSCIVEIGNIVLVNEELFINDIGFSMLPILDQQGNLTFGTYILPIFDPSIDWETLNYFGEENAWDLLENFYSDLGVNLTKKYVIVKLTDDTRKNLYSDPTRFDKYSFDFLLDENCRINDEDYLQNLIENSPNLEDTEFVHIPMEIEEGI